jgi:hypothetical protein
MNVLIYDIETMQELFLIHVYDPKEDKNYIPFKGREDIQKATTKWKGVKIEIEI